MTESLDYGSFTAVVAAFAMSIPVGDLLWMDLQTRGLPPGGCICDIQSLADNQRTNRGLLASHSRRKISLHDSRNSFDGLSEPSGTPV